MAPVIHRLEPAGLSNKLEVQLDGLRSGKEVAMSVNFYDQTRINESYQMILTKC